MAYENQVELIPLSSDQFGPAEIKLWMCWGEFDNANRHYWRQVEGDSVTLEATSPFTFTMHLGPDFQAESKDIALSIHSAALPLRDGPWFRSGVFGALPTPFPGDANGFIEVILAPMQEFSMKELEEGLPKLPMKIPGRSEQVTGLKLKTSGSGPTSRSLTLVATGTSGATTFTYTLEFQIIPSVDVRNLTSVVAIAALRDSLTFTANPGGGFQAFFKNLIAGFAVEQITPGVLKLIEASVSQAAINGASLSFQARNPDGSVPPLPAGVVLSMRAIDHLEPTASSESVLRAWGALGSFGSLKDKFPPRPGGPASCALSHMAIEPHAGIALPVFRGVRDGVLATTARGRELTRQYYAHRSEVIRLLAEPQLGREASELARAVQPLLAFGGPLPQTLIERADQFLEAMAKHASWRLRSDLRRARNDWPSVLQHVNHRASRRVESATRASADTH